MLTKIKRVIFFWGVALSIPLALHAADPPVPDQARDQLVSQSESFRKQASIRPPEREGEAEIEAKEKEEPIAQEGQFRFLVHNIQLEGITLFPREDLAVYLSQFENRENSFGDLKKLAQAITNHYRSRGYTTSRAYLPPQKIENGTVTIRVIEGKIGKIIIEGNRYFRSKLYEQTFVLPDDRIFQYQDLESGLYYLNQKPDRRAKAYLTPSDQPEQSDIILKAEESVPVHFAYEYNNRGTKFTHRSRHIMRFTHNNFLGIGDIFDTNLSLSEEGAFTAGAFSYSYTFEKTGTTFDVDASISESMLVKSLKAFEVKGKSRSITPGILQRIMRTPRFSMAGFLGFEIKDSMTLIDDFKTSFDRSRAVKAGPRVSYLDKFGKSFLEADVHWGIPNFMGSLDNTDPRASRRFSGGEFIYYTLSVARLQRLPFNSYLTSRFGSQFTNDSLTSLEQFRAGGAISVRGYPESEVAGDYGFTFSHELNMPVPFVPKTWEMPGSTKKIADAVRLVTFIEGGKSYLLHRYSPETVQNQFLLGTGFGVRMDLGRSAYLQSDFGFPIGDKSTEEDKLQAHLSISSGF